MKLWTAFDRATESGGIFFYHGDKSLGSIKVGKFVVCFFVGNSPASEFYMPTFRNTLFHLHRQVRMKMTRFEKCWGIYTGKVLDKYIPQHFSNLVILRTDLPMKMEQTERSETSAYKIQTAGDYPEESIQHS